MDVDILYKMVLLTQSRSTVKFNLKYSLVCYCLAPTLTNFSFRCFQLLKVVFLIGIFMFTRVYVYGVFMLYVFLYVFLCFTYLTTR